MNGAMLGRAGVDGHPADRIQHAASGLGASTVWLRHRMHAPRIPQWIRIRLKIMYDVGLEP